MGRGWVLPCQAVERVDAKWPGWIRVRLVDADGRAWFFVDKVPIFADFGPDATMPASVHLVCDIVAQAGHRAVVEPRWHVEAEDGTRQFTVHVDQLGPPED